MDNMDNVFRFGNAATQQCEGLVWTPANPSSHTRKGLG